VFSKQLFIVSHGLNERSFYPTYQKLLRNQQRPYIELKTDQEKQMRFMIAFCYENIPYYHNLFKKLNLSPHNIKYIEDLEKIPILTKEIIKQNWNDFKPFNLLKMKYSEVTTGGSTGTPLSFRLSKQDRFLSGAILYRGWGYGGYELGDKMVILGGSSLNIGSKFQVTKFIDEKVRNFKKLSSIDLGEVEMQQYTKKINAIKPKFVRGYASSIYFYAQWLEKNGLIVPTPNTVFTTADKLYPQMRKTIERVFRCEVLEGYGLNDGGVSAYECLEHSGFHIDTERSILEVVDDKGNQLCNGEGQILATSLYNYAMPFIRYKTEDLAIITDYHCSCGRQTLLLNEIIGREKEFLITPNGKHVYGADLIFLIFIESKILDIGNRIKEFQIIQSELNKIKILLVCDDILPDNALDNMRVALQKRYNDWDIEFRFVETIEKTRAGKFKFIINEVSNV